MVYWDPLQDYFWNCKVCHESLSQRQSYFGSSPKFKNSILGSLTPIRGSIIDFWALKPLPSESPKNSTQRWWSNFCSSPKLKNSILGSLRSIRANEGVNYQFLGFQTIAIVIAMKFYAGLVV